MYYYYDVLLNFQDSENLYNFYEWEESDDVNFVKKIPLFRISSESLKDLYVYQVKFTFEFVNEIKNKTMLKSSSKTLSNAFIVSDAKDSLAIELDDEGNIISRSKLLLDDEINLSEVMFTMKETKLKYEKLSKFKKREMIRQVEEIKKLINCEINTLYESKNVSKLKYLYYEWFNVLNENTEDMYKKMMYDLKNNFNANQKRIYDVIKKSYHKVI